MCRTLIPAGICSLLKALSFSLHSTSALQRLFFVIFWKIRRHHAHAEIGDDADDLECRAKGHRVFDYGRDRFLPALIMDEVDGQRDAFVYFVRTCPWELSSHGNALAVTL